MMKFRSFAVTAALLAGLTAPALAADVSAKNPESVRQALADLGYTAELKTAADGLASISMTVDGSPSYVDFWNCDDSKKDCKTLMLVYGMDLENGSTVDKA